MPLYIYKMMSSDMCTDSAGLPAVRAAIDASRALLTVDPSGSMKRVVARRKVMKTSFRKISTSTSSESSIGDSAPTDRRLDIKNNDEPKQGPSTSQAIKALDIDSSMKRLVVCRKVKRTSFRKITSSSSSESSTGDGRPNEPQADIANSEPSDIPINKPSDIPINRPWPKHLPEGFRGHTTEHKFPPYRFLPGREVPLAYMFAYASWEAEDEVFLPSPPPPPPKKPSKFKKMVKRVQKILRIQKKVRKPGMRK